MNFDQLVEELATAGSAVSASECHGMVCGMLVAGYNAAEEVPTQLATAIEVDYSSISAWAGSLALQCQQSIGSADFSFSPWVPEEQESLRDSLLTLAEWCEGLLYGIGGAGREALNKAENRELREILNDIVNIAREARVDEAYEGSEEDEADFSEVLEYLRVCAQYLYQELVVRPLAETTKTMAKIDEEQPTLH